jgi:hypothetical protein
MKKTILFPLLIFISSTQLILACNKNDITVIDNEIDELVIEEVGVSYDLTGDWKVIAFEDYETSIVITKTDSNTWGWSNNGDNTISFNPLTDTSGTVLGKFVTNTFNSNYQIDLQGGIEYNGGVVTLVPEPEWGQLFHSIFEVESYEIINEQLIAYYNQKNNSITLERIE